MESLILVGGGLANGLIAYFLAKAGVAVKPLLIEQGPRLGGNHTWSFHHDDVAPTARALLEPFVDASWRYQSVAFPSLSRRLATPYHAMTSSTFHDVLMAEIGARVLLDTEVVELAPRYVVLADGRVRFARAVIDARGPAPSLPLAIPVGFQKFVGLDVELEEPHGLDAPVIMDATVPQIDGFRFVYLLPWTPSRVLIEDTYYSDRPTLSRDALVSGIRAYAEGRGWQIRNVVREEQGVLPIPIGGELDAIWPTASRTPRAGATAGLVHPTTGYSVPYAAEVAAAVAAAPELDARALYELLRGIAETAWERGRFFRFLNRMLFRAAVPGERVDVFERFYRLPEPLIQRFYRGRLRWRDGARVLVGKPPVDVRRALACLRDDAAGALTQEMEGA